MSIAHKFYTCDGYLKDKLLPKEGLRVKPPIWLLTTKSQELPRFTYVQVVCDVLLESFQQGLQLFFRSHLIMATLLGFYNFW